MFTNPLLQAGGGSFSVRRIQSGSATLNSGTPTVVTTIKKVDLDSTVLFSRAATSNSTSSGLAMMPRTVFTDAITLTTTVTPAVSGSGFADWDVVEFNGIKRVQRGSVSSGASGSINIKRVDQRKSIIIVNAGSADTGTVAASLISRVIFQDATTLAYSNSGLGTVYIDWQVVEFN